MSGIRRLIQEIHRRSLWQVLGIYLGGSWFVLQVADHLVSKFGLPPWTYGLAFLLLLVGLPIVMATAFVQEGVSGPEEEPAKGAAPPAARRGAWRLFNWRNAILGGLVAFAMWGLVAAGWLLLLKRDPEALPWPRPESASTEPAVRRSENPAGSVRAALGPAVHGTAGVSVAESAGPPPAHRASSRRKAPSAATASPDLREYEAARSRADEARSAAVAVSADSLAEEVVGAGDSLRIAGLEAAAAGRYAEAASAMTQALATYADARRNAVSHWKEALSAKETRVSAVREEADTTREEYARAREMEGRVSGLAASERYGDALATLDAAADLYEAARRPRRVDAAPPPPRPTRPDPRVTVRELLGRLSAALSAEDLGKVQEVWTSLSPAESANIARFFRDRRDIHVTFDVDWSSLSASANRIGFAVRTTWTYFDEGRGEIVQQQPFVQRFVALRAGDAWSLESP